MKETFRANTYSFHLSAFIYTRHIKSRCDARYNLQYQLTFFASFPAGACPAIPHLLPAALPPDELVMLDGDFLCIRLNNCIVCGMELSTSSRGLCFGLLFETI